MHTVVEGGQCVEVQKSGIFKPAPCLHVLFRISKTRLNAATKRQLKSAGYKDKLQLTPEDLSKALKEVGG
jgi:hypothetical protein